MLALATTCIAVAVPAIQPAPAEAAETGWSAYQPLAKPERLADTRAEYGSFGFKRIDQNTIRVQVNGRFGISGASAAVLNVVSLNAWGPSFVTVWPSGVPMPTASNVNLLPGQIMANMVTVQLGANGAVDIFTLQPSELAVDISGIYVPKISSKEGRFVPRSDGAKRVYDSRDYGGRMQAGETRQIAIYNPSESQPLIPRTASAVVVNVTATEAGLGFYTVFPGAETNLPATSTLNLDGANQTRAAQAIVKMDESRNYLKIFSLHGGHVIVDVAGYYTGSADQLASDGLFKPTAPDRLGDTRNQVMPLWGDSTVEFGAKVPATVFASAVVVNLTMTQTLAAGFLTAFPAGLAKPWSSNVNATGWDVTIANHAMIPISTRGLSLYTSHGSHMIADLAGWFRSGVKPPTAGPAAPNPSYGPNKANLAITHQIPCTPLANSWVGDCRVLPVVAGQHWELDYIANQGWGAAYDGHDMVGTAGNVMIFGHRTSNPEPMYYIDRVPYGSTVSLRGSDGNWYDYVVVRHDITPADAQYIDNIGRAVGGPLGMTVQLIACHPLHSIRERWVVTARFVGVRPG